MTLTGRRTVDNQRRAGSVARPTFILSDTRVLPVRERLVLAHTPTSQTDALTGIIGGFCAGDLIESA